MKKTLNEQVTRIKNIMGLNESYEDWGQEDEKYQRVSMDSASDWPKNGENDDYADETFGDGSQESEFSEEEELQEIGMTWLTRIKIDSPKNETMSDEEKGEQSRLFQNQYNGKIAVEFNDGEWFSGDGKKIDIDDFEKYVHGDQMYGRMNSDPVGSREKFRKGRDIEYPSHESKWEGFDQYKDYQRSPEAQNKYMEMIARNRARIANGEKLS